MSDHRTSCDELEPLSVETEEPFRSGSNKAARHPSATLPDEVWDVFELDEDTIEPEPEYGDFWGEVDDEML
jgi:hypothetical protein